MAGPIYATVEQLAAYTDEPNAPQHVDRLLASASGLVTHAIQRALYVVDEEGKPTDAAYLAACRDATCEQVSAWVANGVNPVAGRAGVQQAVASKSGAGVSVTYASYAADAKARSDLASGDVLTPAALRILYTAGLLSTQVQARGW